MSRQITAMFYVEGDTDRAAYENFCNAMDKLGDSPVAARDFITLDIADDAAAEHVHRSPRVEAVFDELVDESHEGDPE